jgi:hypothetical protein
VDGMLGGDNVNGRESVQKKNRMGGEARTDRKERENPLFFLVASSGFIVPPQITGNASTAFRFASPSM